MPKGARTIAELDLVVRGVDLRRRRDQREIRRELVEIRAILTDIATPSPAAIDTPAAPSGTFAGTALERARLFCRRWFR